jgi:hypothetical protein
MHDYGKVPIWIKWHVSPPLVQFVPPRIGRRRASHTVALMIEVARMLQRRLLAALQPN